MMPCVSTLYTHLDQNCRITVQVVFSALKGFTATMKGSSSSAMLLPILKCELWFKYLISSTAMTHCSKRDNAAIRNGFVILYRR